MSSNFANRGMASLLTYCFKLDCILQYLLIQWNNDNRESHYFEDRV